MQYLIQKTIIDFFRINKKTRKTRNNTNEKIATRRNLTRQMND